MHPAGGRFNTARFFVEHPHIAWVALVATLAWGAWAYVQMPQRKDPEILVKTATVTAAWPGAEAADVEQLVARPLELLVAQVPHVDEIESITRTGTTTLFVTLEDDVGKQELEEAWNDLESRLQTLRGLPAGALRPLLNTHFGDTATVLYSVASPPVDEVEVDVRAASIRKAIEAHRAGKPDAAGRAAKVFVFPAGVDGRTVAAAARKYLETGERMGAIADGAVLGGGGFVAIDYSPRGEERIAALDAHFRQEVMGGELPHPDIWTPILVRDPAAVRAQLVASAGDKYSYRELDEFTTVLRDELARLPAVGRVERYGVVPEKLYLLYSQERLASFDLQPQRVAAALRGRNVILPGGSVAAGRQTILLEPSGAFEDERDVLDAPVARTKDGRTVYVRDVAEVHRTYETPVSDASWVSWRDARGGWHRTRSLAVAVQARSGVQVAELGHELDARVEELRHRLPADLRVVKTSDQPELVREKIGEFSRSLVEAVAIVIGVALLFMERRSALLVAASVPLALAMTFGLMQLLGIDLQQVSIASLIIALGLLVDDPVVAADAINRELAAGTPRRRAAWLGPTRLAKAILFATLTNVVAFAPLLLVEGSMGEFIYSLPVVVSLALLSSRVVSMTFMPLLGMYLLRGQRGVEAGGARSARVAAWYRRAVDAMLRRKRRSLVAAAVFLGVGLAPALLIRTQFFPEEDLERFYVEVRLPEGSDVRATHDVLERARTTILAREGEALEQITSFVGGGEPRWWANVGPEPKNPAYGVLILQARDPAESRPMQGRIQETLTRSVPGARFAVYRLSSGAPAVVPVEVRMSGPDIQVLRRLSEAAKGIFRTLPASGEVSDDWGAEGARLGVEVDDARAGRAGVTHADVASSTTTALSGQAVTQLRDGDRLIDIVLRLTPSERASTSSVRDLYVWGAEGGRAVRLDQIAALEESYEPQKIVRYRQERTITVGASPRAGVLASTLLGDARPRLEAMPLPPGYHLSYGGEYEQQTEAFAGVAVALKVSIALIFLVLVWQFASVFKPLVVFGALPFGMVGAVLGLWATRTNFGFMAFLGVTSLMGVIVSHIIVLNDFIEEAREEGVPLRKAVVDAGLVRLRPVLTTVLATVGGLIPLAIEGGPMWQQLVYVLVAGLLLASFVTLGVVPLLYVVLVEDLKLVAWKPTERDDAAAHT
ncbi:MULTISPECIES: efflux RND transporter permease subunit [Anaeromyxobacter]|uniref:efflux RND transporter permease subunit n=1 Tax=Anaeromyxobacter TaxID=161492 RepID=UPI001F57FE02|nr:MULTISPECIES: efflux RND transporter permease subunit [unclassified Anaeromyxobacter]